MKRRGRGSNAVRLESAPLPPSRQPRKGGEIIAMNHNSHYSDTPPASSHHRRLSLENQQQPSTEDCTVSERSTTKRSATHESNWHVSIENKDWTLLQKYLEQLSSPPPPHSMNRMADKSRSNHSTSMRNSHFNNDKTNEHNAGKKKSPSKRASAIGNWLKKKTVGSLRNVKSGVDSSQREESGVDRNSSIFDRNSNINESYHEYEMPVTSPSAQQEQQHYYLVDKVSLLTANAAGRTPLQVALNTPEMPDSILHNLLRAQPRAVSRTDARGRLPLHFAIVKRRKMETIQALVELYVEALYHKDEKGKTPVAYALEVAKRHTHLSEAPKHFWALPSSPHSLEAQWQASQTQHWEMARWCLETSASQLPHQQMHGHYAYDPALRQQSSLEDFLVQTNSDNHTQPYLIQAMLHAAPPTVVTLLIDASRSLLQLQISSTTGNDDYDSDNDGDDEDENQQAVSLGCSAFYLAIFRQYPLSILKQLGSLLSTSNDVKTVRDETGLGLVSAHYVTKCFEKSKLVDYVAAEEFMVTVEQCIVEGALPHDNPQFIEWWDKLKYLIFFCANKNPEDTPDDYLLHSALENTDTPPNVIRLLLALYPGSARQPDEQSAHPLHLFAMHRDYIPRNYESPYMHGLNVMDILLSLDESAAFHNFQNRLPLHHAIAAGRTWSTVHPLISSYRSSLRIPDPITKLYPPLLAAAYRAETEDEEITRLLQLTRNQYSSIVWQGLPEKKKTRAVERIRQFESLKRLDTIFELLRRFPQSLEGAVPRPQKKENSKYKEIVVEPIGSTANQTVARPDRTSSETAGPEMIAFHYLSWCYKKSDNRWHVVDKNMEILQTNIGVATEHAVLSKKSTDFVNWWGMLRLYFWHCYSAMSSPQKMEIPREDDFLLHVALSIPTTPPDLVELILGLFPKSSSLAIPGTRTYPLHLACKTTTYTPQYFEILKRRSTIELVLQSFPEAVFVRSDNGQMPLHIAIQAGKTFSELGPLIQQGPSLVSAPDPVTGLYPFQLMAMSKTPSNDLRLRFQTIASNRHAEGWNRLTVRRKMKAIEAVENEYQKRVFTSMFELLRLKPAAVLLFKHSEEVETGLSAEVGERLSLVGMDFSDSHASDHDEPKKKAPLRRLLSGLSLDGSTGSCGRSAFSTIDMMSTISNVSSHLSFRRRRTVNRTTSNASDKLPLSALEGFGSDSDSDSDDESEASDIWSEDLSFHEEIEKNRKIRTQRGRQSPPRGITPQTPTRRRKTKAKWQPPGDLFVAENSSRSKSLERRSVPAVVVEPMDAATDDDVSFLDGINPSSLSGRCDSLRQALLGDSISTNEEFSVLGDSEDDDSEDEDSEADETSASDSAESIQSVEENTSQSSSTESIQSVKEDVGQNEAPQLAGQLLDEAPVAGAAGVKNSHSIEIQPATVGNVAPRADRDEGPVAGSAEIEDLHRTEQQPATMETASPRAGRGDHPVDGSAEIEDLQRAEQQPAMMEKTAPMADRAGDFGDDDSIQDEIIDTDKKPAANPGKEQEEPAIIFRLRRSSCQRRGGGGPGRMMRPGRKSLGGSQQNGSSVDMDFLSILNASLPEGKMDYLSTLEVSSTSLPPNSDSMPTGLDASRSGKVDRMDQIKELPSESEHKAGAKQQHMDTSISRSFHFEDAVTAQTESGLPMSQTRRRSSLTRMASPIGSPRTSIRGSIRQSMTATGSPGGRRSSREINPSTCNYIGIKPQKLKSCLHCGKHDREVMMLPCNHLCLCRVCSDEADINSCLLCFGPVEEQRVVS